MDESVASTSSNAAIPATATQPALDQAGPEAENDLVANIRQILNSSPEPLTAAKIWDLLAPAVRPASRQALQDTLHQQAGVRVLVEFPGYRSQNKRYWDRPFTEHVEALLRSLLHQGPLNWSEIRRRLPDYARSQAQRMLDDKVAAGEWYRHPSTGRRGMRFGLERPDPLPYLRIEFLALFRRMETLGFPRAAVCAAAMELVHEELWGGPAPAAGQAAALATAAPPCETTANPS